MKRILTVFLSIAITNFLFSQSRVSLTDNKWQQGGLFFGKTPQQEILAARSAYTKKFDIGNGKIELFFGGPFHYSDRNGNWQDIDLTIKETQNEEYSFNNTENLFSSGFASQAKDGVQLEQNGNKIKVGINTKIFSENWILAQSGTKSTTASFNNIRYNNIFENTDLSYQLTTNSVQHYLYFKNRNSFANLPAGNSNVFVEETIEIPEGAIMEDDLGTVNSNRKINGNIKVIVKSETLFTIWGSCIWDATFSGNPEEQRQLPEQPVNFKNIETEIQFLTSGKFRLMASIPSSWLLDPQRIYPIVFDPTVGIGNQTGFNASYRYPFNTCRQQRVSQILFLKSDINAGGTTTTGAITDIAFFQNSAAPVSNNNVQIKMQEVSWTEMTTPTLTSSGFSTVYGPSTQNFTSGSNQWRTLSLSSPFSFTNTKNLLIEARFANTSSTPGCTCDNTGPGGYWGWYNAPYPGHRWAYSNSAATPPSGASCEYNNSPERNPAYGFFIPATKITINTTSGCVPVSFTTQPQAQAVVAPATAQFSVTASGSAPTYQWEMSTNGGTTWSNVPATAPYSGVISNQLTINPTNASMNGYRFRCKGSNTCTSPSPAISGQGVLTVNASGCTTVLTPTVSASIPATGGTGSFNINVTPNTCSWSASENQSWLTITSALNGTGDATLNYTVSANTGTPRTGIITVNGQSYTVNQLGAAAPTTYTISGRVVENGSTGLPLVAISTTPNLGNAVTDPQGYYSIAVPLTFTGTVKATLAPYTFIPSTRAVSSTSYTNKDFDADAVSFQITNSVIPPWQREGDDFNGSITVALDGTTTSNWHIEADVYDANNNHRGNVQFPTTTSLTSNFAAVGTANTSSPQRQLFDLSREGYTVKYAAVFDANTTLQAYPGASTSIIERKWEKKNFVYWRDVSSPDVLNIPMKWNSNPINQAAYIKVKRFGSTSYILPGIISNTQGDTYSSEKYDLYPQNLNIGKYPVTLKNNSGINHFIVNQTTGYCEIKAANSNIFSSILLPGDFKYEVYNSTGTLLESGYFDLTKVGRISANPISNKVIIIIGGIMNETEISSDSLKLNIATSNNSLYTYSVIEYVRNNFPQFSTWYIGQGNSNTIARNGYDIGIAIERIRKLNNIPSNDPTAEIILFCHSKGGLDTRSLLTETNNSTYYNQSFNNLIYSFKDSVIYPLVKKVIFLGTPHKGAPIENLLNWLGINLASSPGAKDLKNDASILFNLNESISTLPSHIKYCNVTGYSMFPLVGYGDLVVPESSSLGINTPPNTKLQLRQLGSSPISLNHFSIHKSKRLDYIPTILYRWFMCYSDITNLDKIKDFVNNGTLVYNCFPTSFVVNIQGIDFYKSKVANAKVLLKKSNSIIDLGYTDEEGNLFVGIYLPIEISDSLIIKASGVDELRFPFYKLSEENKYLSRIATFKSFHDSTKILYPSVSFISQTPITRNKTLELRITGKNIFSFEKNEENSDSIFNPLIVNNSIATVYLDTGYNKLLIRLIGVDTIVLRKDIYFLPDPFYEVMTRKLLINVPGAYSGANLYVNNKYYSVLDAGINSIYIFNDGQEVRISRLGYFDTTFVVDNASNINLIMDSKNYSSIVDSITYNFENRPNPQYWKTITIKNLSPFSNVEVSAKQLYDPFTGMSLKPQTRKFAFRRLGSPGQAGYYKTAIALDQINTPIKDSIYLLSIKGNRYIKYQPNDPGITEYDPEVQKLEFDKLDFTSNSTHDIVLMQKQAPLMKPLDTLWHSGQTLAFPISMFVSDPDSIKNDLTATSSDVKVVVDGNMIYVTAPVNFVGTTSYTLTGIHDWLNRTMTYTMKVIPPEVFVPSGFTPNNDGKNDILAPVFMGKILYCHLSVFNRYGQKVFETKDCLAGWNGRIGGIEQATGSYVYYLKYKFEGIKEDEKSVKGVFTLIR